MIGSAGIDARSPAPRRRRWLIGLALLCLLLVVAGAVVWAIDRPLSVTERRLVGTWRNRNLNNPAVFTFHSDRTITAAGHPPGIWHMRKHRLYEADSRLMEAVQALLHPEVDQSYELTFEDDDTISVFVPANGGRFKWHRVPES